ncbi:MAG TPA: GTPase Era [Gammaproteobacteria bacterium]|jgi:GTP-binding protein Era|nr:GTPase Era [Gammaproteobacteria bacterium]
MSDNAFRCGFIAIAGRPNVGKSTLINALVGHKVSIVSPKPQTTRHRVLGIHNTDTSQLIFVDTPGIHDGGKRVLNRRMNRSAANAISDADMVLLMVEALRWTEQDDWVLRQCVQTKRPLGVIVNKIDTLQSSTQLLPYLQALQSKAEFIFMVPVSARDHDNLEELEQLVTQQLPESPALYPREQVTDQTQTARAAEFIREQLMLALQQEVPYSIAVQVDEFVDEAKLLRISATIWVEREGQKAIVIGHDGALLKKVGRGARLELQKIFGKKIFLQLWVKVRENWADDERSLRQFGIEDT